MTALWSNSIVCQTPNITISHDDYDMNHYSIELAADGNYICAGTLFDANGLTDIHVVELTASGSINWEFIYNVSDDDRALDIVVDKSGQVIITGYATDGRTGLPELFVLKLDNMGNMVAEMKYQIGPTTVGTNIIINSDGNYVIGGFIADFLTLPLSNNQAFLLEVDANNLNSFNTRIFNSNNWTASAINDIIELPDGYFLTGSIGISGFLPIQAALALIVDDSFTVTSDLSFVSSNAFQVGVSCVYDITEDNVYLLSNNSEFHNPQITLISNISAFPQISAQQVLLVDPGLSTNPAGFQLIQSPFNDNSLIAVGYYQRIDNTNFPGGTSVDASPWMTEVSKDLGSMNTLLWPAPSPNFSNHGGNVLSTFATPMVNIPGGTMPVLFNQEITTIDHSGIGFTFIGPREVNGRFAIDVKHVNSMNQSCLIPMPSNIIPRTDLSINVFQQKIATQDNRINLSPQFDPFLIQDIICTSDPCPECIVLLNDGCGVNYELLVEGCFPLANIIDYRWDIPALNITGHMGQVVPFSSFGGTFPYTLTIRFINSAGLIQTCTFTDFVTVPTFNCTDLITSVDFTHQCNDSFDLQIDVDPCFDVTSVSNVNLTKFNTSCSVITNGTGQTHSFNLGNCGIGTYQLSATITISDGIDSIQCPLSASQPNLNYLLGSECSADLGVSTQTINQWAPANLCSPSPPSYLQHSVMSPLGSCYKYYWNNSSIPTGPVYNCCYTWDPLCSNPSLTIIDTCNCCEYVIADVTNLFRSTGGDTNSALIDLNDVDINYLVTPSQNNNFTEDQTIRSSKETNDNARIETNEEFKVFPNPAREVAYLEFNSSAPKKISVIDVKGNKLINFESDYKTVHLDVNTLNPGIYLIIVQNKITGKMANQRIVIY